MSVDQSLAQEQGRKRRVAIFASVDSFEGFYGGTFGLDRESYLKNYRNDFVWEYAEGLRRLGHEVFIYMLSYGPPLLRKISAGLNVRFLPLPLWLRLLDPVLFRLRKRSYIPALRDRVAYLGYGSKLHEAIKCDQVDVMYHQEIWTPRFDVIVQRHRIPIVGADQGAVYAEWMAPAKRRSLRLAAKLLCQSLTGLDRVKALGSEATLMYNGVDTDFFSPSDSAHTRAKTILAVGRLVEEQKRFSDLLVAMVDLEDFNLILVGSGPDEQLLKKLAVQLNLGERVHFAGFVTEREQLRTLYQTCGVFVSTSSWEAVALVMLEAMSSGAAVVATRIPSFEDLLTDAKDGLLVPVGSPKALAEAISTAYQNRGALGAHARETVLTRYSSSTLYQRLSDLVEAV